MHTSDFHKVFQGFRTQQNDMDQATVDLLVKYGLPGLLAGAVYFGCRSAGALLVGIGERFLNLSTQFAHDVKEGMDRIEAAIRSQELKVAVLQERIERIDNELSNNRRSKEQEKK